MKSKRELYESIMHLISVEVKKALNEYNKYEDCDHRRGGNIKDLKFLQHVLQYEHGYKASLVSSTLNVPYNLIVRREDNERRQVYVQQKKKGTTTGNIAITIRKYGDAESILDNPQIDEICVVCPPAMNSDPMGNIVDNTKACFFDKDFIIDALKNRELEVKKTHDGETLIIPDRWAKVNAKEVIVYQYKR